MAKGLGKTAMSFIHLIHTYSNKSITVNIIQLNINNFAKRNTKTFFFQKRNIFRQYPLFMISNLIQLAKSVNQFF